MREICGEPIGVWSCSLPPQHEAEHKAFYAHDLEGTLLAWRITEKASPRERAYRAIDSERAYQKDRWNEQTTTSKNFHSLEEWVMYTEHQLAKAREILCTEARQIADPKALQFIRKAAAVLVAAMEEHGAPRREGY